MPAYDEALDEMFESDEAIDEALDEAAPSWSRPRPRLASGRNLYAPRPQTQYVTQTQLQTALAKVGAQVRTNSDAISQVNTRVAAATASLRKESGDRKKDMTSVRSNLSQTQQMAAIVPLLTQPQHITVGGDIQDTNSATQIKNGTELLVDGGNTLSLLLPFLLLSSVGDSGGGTGGGLFGGGSDNSTFLLLALVLGLGQSKSK